MSLTAPPVDPRAPLLPAVVILGNDAQLAARPATPVQLAHACLALGFRAAIPVSWGDELIAAASLSIVASRPARPAIHCACPHVARRLLAVGTELAPNLVSLVAPPVAAARYLRTHAPGGLRVTYIGRCPGAADDSIDARLTPEEFLAQLAERGIDLHAQPEVFESVIPPDRRRHHSLPGGLPTGEALWAAAQLRSDLLRGEEIATEIAERVLAGAPVLLDPAPAMGCVCSGALRGVAPEAARAAVVALEPPRSAAPVVEAQHALALELPIPAAARAAADVVADVVADEETRRPVPAPRPAPESRPGLPSLELPLGMSTGVAGLEPAPAPRRPRLTPPGSPLAIPSSLHGAPETPPRRRTPPAAPRVVPGAVPVASDQEGRILPRAYVARRRSPRGGVPVVTDRALGSATPAESGADAERPIEHSVEPPGTVAPVAAPVTPPAPPLVAAADQRHLAPPARGPLERALTFVSSNPRVTLAILLGALGMLLGVALGYAAARRGPARSEANGPRSERLQLDSSAASAAPSLTAPPSIASSIASSNASRSPRTTRMPPRRRGGGAGNAISEGSVAPVVGTRSDTAGAVASSPTPVAAAPAVDSSAVRLRRDSLAAVARAESLAAEREALRRQIERSRARIDSLERARGSAPTP